MRDLEVNGSRVRILPCIKGLVSEGERVREAVENLNPDVLAISIGREELSGLRELEEDFEYEMSGIERAYADGLSEFGEVVLPPPCYTSALETAEGMGIPIIPIDMNEELYSATYCVSVGTADLIKESFLSKRVEKLRFDLSSPGEFVMDWDRRVNRSKGFSSLQAKREDHMAKVLRRMSKRYRNILAVVELERSEGVLSSLDRDTGR
ncbi:MAG: hypothetical protein ACLFPN_03330 [Methanomassiliicoccales archaeon]